VTARVVIAMSGIAGLCAVVVPVARAADAVTATSDGSALVRVSLPPSGAGVELGGAGPGSLGTGVTASVPIQAGGGCHAESEVTFCDVPIGECTPAHVCPAFGRVIVDGGAGRDGIELTGVFARETVSISGAGGDDRIVVQGAPSPVLIDAGDGNDAVIVFGAQAPVRLDAGPGDDQISVEESAQGQLICGPGADELDPWPPAGVQLDTASCPPFVDPLYRIGPSPGGGRAPKTRSFRVRHGRVRLTPFAVTEAVTGTLTIGSMQFTGPRVRRFTRRAQITGGPGPISASYRVPGRLLPIRTPTLIELDATDAGGDRVTARGLVRLRRR
jgi:hypothetical protein